MEIQILDHFLYNIYNDLGTYISCELAAVHATGFHFFQLKTRNGKYLFKKTSNEQNVFQFTVFNLS